MKPCRHCGDADASEETGLCYPCERDDALAKPGVHVLGTGIVSRPRTIIVGSPSVEHFARLQVRAIRIKERMAAL